MLLVAAVGAFGSVLDIRDCGAVPDSLVHNVSNADAISRCFLNATAGDTVLVPAGFTFFTIGGIRAADLDGVTVTVDGNVSAVADFDLWPLDGTKYRDVMNFAGCSNLHIGGAGTVDGQGLPWWNKWVLGKTDGKHRPHLIVLDKCTDCLVESIRMINSPNFHLLLADVARVEVRFVHVEVNRKAIRGAKALRRMLRLQANETIPSAWGAGGNPVLQPEDLNTDGIDPSGTDIYIHDSYINNDDDSIAVKPCTRRRCTNAATDGCTANLLVENMVLSGFGASVGSVPADVVREGDTRNCIRNVTFRNISMPETGKGIYIKSNPDCSHPNASALIQDILFETVRITNPRWWAIWIGPQQQHQPGSPLGQDCAIDYPISPACPTQACVDFRGIVLRDVTVESPVLSPGVILGNESNPMDVTFDGVAVTKWNIVPPPPFGKEYRCESTDLKLAPGSTNSPLPDCS